MDPNTTKIKTLIEKDLYKGQILKDLCVIAPLTLMSEILNILQQEHRN